MKYLLSMLIRAYRLFLSPSLGLSCRFEPTCSLYALQALDQHGATAGSYLMLARLVRCHPWCEGGFDAVPEHPPRLFSCLTSKSASIADQKTKLSAKSAAELNLANQLSQADSPDSSR